MAGIPPVFGQSDQTLRLAALGPKGTFPSAVDLSCCRGLNFILLAAE